MELARILVVDDDPDIQLALRARLKANGYEVQLVADGASAVAAARDAAPDLILLDIRLPGEDGFGVLARLKARPELAAIPVIMLSANDPESMERRALDCGAAAYCCKPFSAGELLGSIETALGR